MTAVLFAKIPDSLRSDTLAALVRKSFPHKENEGYFDVLEKRRNRDSVKESFAALALLRELLNMRGIGTDRLVFRRSESGKPYFEGMKLRFSLSHSKGYVAAALSESTEVGIDIECADVPTDRAEKIINRFFCKGCEGCEGCEGEFAPSSPRAEPSPSAEPSSTAEPSPTARSFARLWTKTEAYAKMRGTGLGEAISNGDLLRACTEDERGEAFFEYFDADGYPLTACLEKKDGEIDFCGIDLEELIKKAEI